MKQEYHLLDCDVWCGSGGGNNDDDDDDDIVVV
jgi:hypothetical protein